MLQTRLCMKPSQLYSRVLRRRHCVGGARRSKISAAAAWAAKNIFQRFPKTFSSILKIFWWPFLVIEKCKKTKHTNRVSAARRQIIGCGGAPITKSRRGRPQIDGGVGGAGAWLCFIGICVRLIEVYYATRRLPSHFRWWLYVDSNNINDNNDNVFFIYQTLCIQAASFDLRGSYSSLITLCDNKDN